MADAITAIKYHVFDTKNLAMPELMAVLRDDFTGHERVRQLPLNKTPKYGNDDDYSDDVMVAIFDAIDGRLNTKGVRYCINLLPTTCTCILVRSSGPRRMIEGRGTLFPRAFRPCRARTGVALWQLSNRWPRWTTSAPAAPCSTRSSPLSCSRTTTPWTSCSTWREHFQIVRPSHPVQCRGRRRAAQKNPEQYCSLIVRVACYSDYFCDLSQALQDEIIARTEHQAF